MIDEIHTEEEMREFCLYHIKQGDFCAHTLLSVEKNLGYEYFGFDMTGWSDAEAEPFPCTEDMIENGEKVVHIIKKFIDLKNKKNNFTISEFDPILEMIKSGKGILPITGSWVESPISKDTFYCSNCGYSPDIGSIIYMNYCPNCGNKKA